MILALPPYLFTHIAFVLIWLPIPALRAEMSYLMLHPQQILSIYSTYYTYYKYLYNRYLIND